MYRPRWAKPANRAYAELDASWKRRVLNAVEGLRDDPTGSAGVEPLHGPLKGLFRRRIGNLRIIFSVDHAALEIHVRTIDWRGGAY